MCILELGHLILVSICAEESWWRSELHFVMNERLAARQTAFHDGDDDDEDHCDDDDDDDSDDVFVDDNDYDDKEELQQAVRPCIHCNHWDQKKKEL